MTLTKNIALSVLFYVIWSSNSAVAQPYRTRFNQESVLA